jgi:N-acetylglucosamine malate deacetylase 1
MNILIISAHPDDETLGCGGSILKHAQNDDRLFWIIASNSLSEERKKIRKIEIDKVREKFSIFRSHNLNYPTTKLDMISKSELIERISKIILDVEPEIIYLPNRSDVHSDHRIVFDAAYSCTKSFRYPFIKKVLMYETLSETEFSPALNECAFVPNYFIDISDYMEQKIEIMKIYESEVMTDNFPRSVSAIKSLAGFRGSRIGVKYAEAFMLLFEKS